MADIWPVSYFFHEAMNSQGILFRKTLSFCLAGKNDSQWLLFLSLKGKYYLIDLYTSEIKLAKINRQAVYDKMCLLHLKYLS